jgi:hypothetical protein
MKRLLALLLVLALVRIGFTYLDSSDAASETVNGPINTQEYFFGVKNAESNLNQVLALLVGKSGTPGPVGVAGADGVIGMNGVNGADGIPGAPGAMGVPGPAGASGRDGAGVLAVPFTGNQNGCTSGGLRLTDAAGVVSFICNGAPGAPGAAGATGATGATGAAGSGSGGTLGFGQGEVTVGPCETDGVIAISVSKNYTGDDFRLKELTIGNHGTTGDIKDGCAGKTVGLYLKIVSGTLNNPSGNYANNDIIKCTATLPTAAGWPTTTPQFALNSAALSCVNQTTSTAVTFSNISTADHTPKFGFEIG